MTKQRKWLWVLTSLAGAVAVGIWVYSFILSPVDCRRNRTIELDPVVIEGQP